MSGDSTLSKSYSRTAQYLHWAVAAMIVLQYVLIELAEDSESRIGRLALTANHKSVGMTILVLAVLRLAWRLKVSPPKLPDHMPNWQVQVSGLTHWALYGLLFALPLTGWLMSSAASYSVSWFGLFSWPDLIAPNESRRDVLKFIHEWLGKGLFVLAVVHVLAACKHHFLDKDNVLKRMSAAIPIGLFGLIIVGGALALTDVAEQTAETSADTEGTEPASGADPLEELLQQEPQMETRPAPAGGPPVWAIDYTTSFIEFTGEQAGAEFRGEWQQWRGHLRFEPDALADSALYVQIQTNSVDTGDEERDETIQDSDFFDSEAHPTVIFESGPITTTESGFATEATLTVKGQDFPVTFDFDVAEDGATRLLTGQARLDRLALGIGLGDWADTEWVGQYVDVQVAVSAIVEAP